MALPLGALLLGGGLAGRLCHPGADQVPQGQGLRVAAPIDHGMQMQLGQGRVGRGGGGDGGWSGLGEAHAWVRCGSAAIARSKRGSWRPTSRTLAQVTLPHAAK